MLSFFQGAESTAMKIASKSEQLLSSLWKEISEDKLPVLGTCVKKRFCFSQQELIQTKIVRNAFGRQKESFQSEILVLKLVKAIHSKECVYQSTSIQRGK